MSFFAGTSIAAAPFDQVMKKGAHVSRIISIATSAVVGATWSAGLAALVVTKRR